MAVEPTKQGASALVITADDFGYRPAYDAGIILAARAGAIDRVSVMATRDFDPEPLLELDVALGLHLEPDASVGQQLRDFDAKLGRGPQYIDGHRHCHADPWMTVVVIPVARELGVPVRAINPPHRAQLRRSGIETTDRLVGRQFEHHAAMPLEIDRWLSAGRVPPGTTEWCVHPGYRDPESGSSYDAGRPEDLALLLQLGDRERWRHAGVERSALVASSSPAPSA
jgi:predicted glycoside hydrolase/deacetylase ChbG (UPF0249 family)